MNGLGGSNCVRYFLINSTLGFVNLVLPYYSFVQVKSSNGVEPNIGQQASNCRNIVYGCLLESTKLIIENTIRQDV